MSAEQDMLDEKARRPTSAASSTSAASATRHKSPMTGPGDIEKQNAAPARTLLAESPAHASPTISNEKPPPDMEPIRYEPSNVITRVLSKTTSHVSIDPGPPPDGGFRAWSQVFFAHLVVFNVWGYINSFGVFQSYYLTAMPHETPSSISWIGSIQVFLLFIVGTFSGRALDAGLFRPTFILGSFLFLLGVFTTSASTRYYQVFLSQGVCTGIGNGLLFVPTLGLTSTYFLRKRSLAIAITASGTATGGLVFPAMVQQLLPKIGFAWTVRVLGFLMLALFALSFTFLRTRLPPRKSGPIVEWQAFTELPYLLFTVTMFLLFWGLYFAFYYIPSFSRNILHVSEAHSIDNLLILNGVGIVGRIIPGFIADRYLGPLNTLIPIGFIAGILVYCWTAIHSEGGLIAFSVVYGLFGAAIQSLFPAVLTSLTTDMKKTGVRMGMVFSVESIAFLTGPPLAGALVQRSGGKYLDAQMFAGTVIVAGGLTAVACRMSRVGTAKIKV